LIISQQKCTVKKFKFTLSRREYKGKIYVKNIRKNSCRIRFRTNGKVGSGSGYGYKKIIPNPQHWPQVQYLCCVFLREKCCGF
jgi:hypothetical protein